MIGTVKTALITAALGKSKKTVLARAKKEGWLQGKQAGRWVENRLPMDVRLALANYRPPEVTSKEQAPVNPSHSIINATDRERRIAVLRGSLISECRLSGLRKEDFIASYNSLTGSFLYKELGHVSMRTFYRWEREFTNKGSDGLVPRYGASSGGAGKA